MKLSNLPLSWQHSLAALTIAILAVFAFIFDSSLSDSLIYQRQLISQGEYWRLFTGHFFHTNNYHLYLNLAALVMLWALHGHCYSIKNYLLLFSLSAFSTSIGIYFFSADIIQYVGLSGVLHGVFVWGAAMDIKAQDKTGYLLLAGVWLKIAHEQIYGASADVANLISANVAVDAHLWGGVGGLLFTLLFLIYGKVNKIKQPLDDDNLIN